MPTRAYQAVAVEVDTVCTDTTSDALGVLLASLKFQLLFELFRATYREKMAVFWHSYINLVCLLLRERDGVCTCVTYVRCFHWSLPLTKQTMPGT